MSWLDDFRDELDRAGVGASTKRRLVAELADHLACDASSEARLGPPREVVERFVAELRVARTRRAATRSFVALALAALALAADARLMSPAVGWPDVVGLRGLAVSLAGIVIVLAAQVAFVAGVLALARRPDDPAEASLVQRRVAVALAAGAAVAAGEVVQAVALQPFLPLWWFATALGIASATFVVLGGSAVLLGAARALTTSVFDRPRGFAADLPIALRGYVTAVAPAVGIAVVTAMAAGSTIAERSLAEGLTRGAIEAVAFVGCFGALGRRLGIRS